MNDKISLNYTEFKALLGEEKRTSDPICCRHVFRPLSFPLGWLIYKLGISANHISLLSVGIAFVSSFYYIFGSAHDAVFASCLISIASVNDCIDGNIARARGEAGPGGEWTDALSGYTIYALLPLSLGVHLSSYSHFDVADKTWIVLGALTSIANLFLRLIYQKFLNGLVDPSQKGNIKSSGSIFAKTSSEIGLVGWMMPALLVASITNMLEVYLVLYCCFYLVSATLVSIVLFRKIT